MKASDTIDLREVFERIKKYFTLTKQNIVPKLTYWFTILLVLGLAFSLNYELRNNEKFRKTFICEENNLTNFTINQDFLFEKTEQVNCQENLKQLTKDANNLMNLTLVYMIGVFLFDKWQEHKRKQSQ